jgi:FkbM family methyltransferase
VAEFELNGITLVVPDTMLNLHLRHKLGTGGYEGNEARSARTRVCKGNRVLELGGGLGYIAAICAQQTGPENVVTVEANPELLEVARANLDRNGFDQVRIIFGAITGGKGKNETIGFDKRKIFWAGRLANESSHPGRVVNVPALSLPFLLDEVRPHVVIMDIEGAEEQMFDDPWPAYVQSVLLELHPNCYANSVIKQIVDCMSKSNMTYDPTVSRGNVLGFHRVREK